MRLPQKLLVPTDMSTYSLAALQYAEIVAEVFGAEITVLHVIQSGDQPSAPKAEQRKEPREDKTIEESKKMISNLLVDKDLVIRSIKILVRKGHPAREIVKAAKELDTDVIVMSTHGRTGLRHVLMGSVAEKVVRYAICPVLTVKPEEFRELVSISDDEIAEDLHMN